MKRQSASITLTATLAGLLLAQFTWAEPLTFAASAYLAPYIDSDLDSSPQLAIVRESLAHSGQEMGTTIYTSNKRATLLLRSGQVDGAINVPPGIDGFFYSRPVIHYQNRVISRASEQLDIKRVEDLLDHRIVGFQSARQFLGDEYRDMASRHADYSEVANQKSQVELLLRGRTEVVVMDRHIFQHLKQSLEPALQAIEVVFHPILPETPHYVSFTDSDLRDAFDLGLQHLVDSGRYRKLLMTLDSAPSAKPAISPASPETVH